MDWSKRASQLPKNCRVPVVVDNVWSAARLQGRSSLNSAASRPSTNTWPNLVRLKSSLEAFVQIDKLQLTISSLRRNVETDDRTEPGAVHVAGFVKSSTTILPSRQRGLTAASNECNPTQVARSVADALQVGAQPAASHSSENARSGRNRKPPLQLLSIAWRNAFPANTCPASGVSPGDFPPHLDAGADTRQSEADADRICWSTHVRARHLNCQTSVADVDGSCVEFSPRLLRHQYQQLRWVAEIAAEFS